MVSVLRMIVDVQYGMDRARFFSIQAAAREALEEYQDSKAELFSTTKLPATNCRQRLKAEGKPYPRSSCDSCGKFAPSWRGCDKALSTEKTSNWLSLAEQSMVKAAKISTTPMSLAHKEAAKRMDRFYEEFSKVLDRAHNERLAEKSKALENGYNENR